MANRMAEWPVVVKKESNVSGAKGHAEFDSFDREVRQGRRDKTFHHTARTEAKEFAPADLLGVISSESCPPASRP